MKVITPGYEYELDSGEILCFRSASDPTGMTTEDVLAVLMHRCETQHAALPCGENFHVLQGLRSALGWLGRRADKRAALGVSGTGESHHYPPPVVSNAPN